MLHETAQGVKEHHFKPVKHYFTICYVLLIKLNKNDFYHEKHYLV